ncbi:MAG: carboxymuconolactone decarboxylase family protein [Candidatus Palauibacterales bacterium]|nr:carboxymuconolactone decarboxylase family protein [Candidatus Palauibacterales bacterium]
MSEEEVRSLLRLSATVAAGTRDQRIRAMRAVAAASVREAAEEVILQSYLFLGFPATLTALAEWRDVVGVPPPAEEDPADAREWERRGERVCRTVYGHAYDKLRANVRRAHPAMDDWMIREGYGKVLARRGLDLGTREMCIVSILGATGWEPQLHSHLRGALYAGCRPAAVEEALEAGLEMSPNEAWRRDARALWARVRNRFADDAGGVKKN